VVVPDFDLSTTKARSVLPDTYSRADAVFNVQRSALLIAALATGTVSAFPAAIEDRFHQPYRASLVPGLEEITRLRAPGLLGCVLSGAGPSILVLGSDPSQRLRAAELIAENASTPWECLLLAVDFRGATVVTHSADAVA